MEGSGWGERRGEEEEGERRVDWHGLRERRGDRVGALYFLVIV